MKLVLGDCLEKMKEIEGGSIDAVITDPPYGTTACKWDVIIPFDPMWEELKRITKDNGAICLFGNEPFSSYLRTSNIKMFRYDWIWQKPQGTNPMCAKIMPLKSHEIISVFYKKKPKYNPQMWKSTPYKGFESKEKKIGEIYGNLKSKHRDNPEGLRFPKTIIEHKQEKGLHPTQKPVSLMEYLIKTYTNENEIVLDFTMGSGTTGVACKRLKRNFIGIENDEGYFEIAKKRIEETPELLF
ncbi:MAG: site-specific DNA-methyltransferase [Candidatus Lokiarchaeota archaeon]|nr:site-specific DNA-methyltransferase [Candidatus Lokiarchaeota archaeon]